MAHDYNTGFDPYALQRMDILRGPAGMLFGQGALGGSVNLIASGPRLKPRVRPASATAIMIGEPDFDKLTARQGAVDDRRFQQAKPWSFHSVGNGMVESAVILILRLIFILNIYP